MTIVQILFTVYREAYWDEMTSITERMADTWISWPLHAFEKQSRTDICIKLHEVIYPAYPTNIVI